MPVFLAGAALFGLLAGGLWGVGDFAGGMAAKSGGGSVRAALRVVLFSHAGSLVLLAGFALLRHDSFPRGSALAWGFAAGVLAGLSVSGFYVALSSGGMGASAALSGLLAAAIPAAVSSLRDGLPGWRRFAGFLIAGAAIWLIASGHQTDRGENETRRQGRTTALALLSGAGFGFYFVALRFAGEGGLVWPLATVRMTSVSTCVLVLAGLGLAGRRRATSSVPWRSSGMWLWVAATTVFDTGGNLFLWPQPAPGDWTLRRFWLRSTPPPPFCWPARCSRRDPPAARLSGWRWPWRPCC